MKYSYFKKYGGEKYAWEANLKSKTEAKKYARVIRARGFNVRVVNRSNKLYQLYSRRRR